MTNCRNVDRPKVQLPGCVRIPAAAKLAGISYSRMAVLKLIDSTFPPRKKLVHGIEFFDEEAVRKWVSERVRYRGGCRVNRPQK